MLRFIKNLLRALLGVSVTDGRQIAFWSQEELADLAPRFAELFGVGELNRDYENVWEWLGGVSSHGFEVNVSRSHNWERGDYHRPILIGLRRNGAFLPAEEIAHWAKEVAKHFQVDVSVGVIVEKRRSSKYGFRSDYHFPKPRSAYPERSSAP